MPYDGCILVGIGIGIGIRGVGASDIGCGGRSDQVCDLWRLDGGRTGSLAGISGNVRDPIEAVRTIVLDLCGGGGGAVPISGPGVSTAAVSADGCC